MTCDCSYLIFEKIAAFSPDTFSFPRSVDDVTKVEDLFLLESRISSVDYS